MKNNRRDFLKVAGLTGIGMLGTTGSMGDSLPADEGGGKKYVRHIKKLEQSHVQQSIYC